MRRQIKSAQHGAFADFNGHVHVRAAERSAAWSHLQDATAARARPILIIRIHWRRGRI